MDTLATALFDIVTILAIIGVAAPPAPEPAQEARTAAPAPARTSQARRKRHIGAGGCAEVQQRQAVPTRPVSRTAPGSTDGGVRNDEAGNGEAHD